MKKILAIAVGIALTASVATLYKPQNSDEPQFEYILQGAAKSTILKDVESVGGSVVHEYSIIDAISVRLSSSQLAEIKKLNPMLRSFKDQEVKVSSVIDSFASENAYFNVSEKIVTWQGKNASDVSVVLDSIKLDMPKGNRAIRSITVNGQSLSTRNLKINGSIEISLEEQINLIAGQSIKVDVQFTQLASTNASDYIVSFGETYVASNNESETIAEQKTIISEYENVGAMISFNESASEVSWNIAPQSYYDKQLAGLKLKYPENNHAIRYIKIDGKSVDFNTSDDTQIELQKLVDIYVRQNVSITIGFDELGATNNESYKLALEYADGDKQYAVVPATSYSLGEERNTGYSSLVRANLAHENGITGYGVTVAIIDTGMAELMEVSKNSLGANRSITNVDLLNPEKKKGQIKVYDDNGHGTHLASIIANSSKSVDENGDAVGGYNGIAPDVNLIVLKAFDVEGQSSYKSILSALEYVVENRDVHNIKVLNLSFSALPSSYYWDDPLNQALMKAWQAGITVVAAAGNRGPDAMTIGVPGNTPYVITVGAVSDNYTPNNLNDDFVTTFSSAGPTYEGFVKPEIVAPGGHIQGLMEKWTKIRTEHPRYNGPLDNTIGNHDYFEMSGSSQSTAITSGIVALMLQANPNLTPDDVKCRLVATAKVATDENGELAFSVFQQGAGLVDAMAAIESTESQCGNAGLDIAKDLSGEEHFIGPARRYENDGDYYIPGVEGLEWSGVYNDSQLWRRSSFNSDSQLWRRSSFNADSQLWRHTSFSSNSQLWGNTSFSADSQLWRRSSFDADSQLWRRSSFDADSQLWRRSSFNADSQLWQDNAFDSVSLKTGWIEHE